MSLDLTSFSFHTVANHDSTLLLLPFCSHWCVCAGPVHHVHNLDWINTFAHVKQKTKKKKKKRISIYHIIKLSFLVFYLHQVPAEFSRGHVGKGCSSTGRAQIWALKQCDERSCMWLFPVSQEAVLGGHEGEAIEGVAGTSTGGELWSPTHRAGNRFSGKLWIDVLGVRWTSLKKTNKKKTVVKKMKIEDLKHLKEKKTDFHRHIHSLTTFGL